MNRTFKLLSVIITFQVMLIAVIFTFVAPVNADFSFAAAGDLGGSSGTKFAPVMQKLGALSNPSLSNSVDFFLHVGDLSYVQVTPETAWCQKVKDNINTGVGLPLGNAFGEQYPYQIVSGNHDDDVANALIDNFTQPNCLPNRMPNAVISSNYNGPAGTSNYGKEYYFDYPTSGTPLARFIQIAPNGQFTNGGNYSYSSGDRYDWVKNTIDSARNANIPWVIVTMHENCITTATKNCSIGAALTHLLFSRDASNRQRVDLILQGHDHTYQRTKQLSCNGSETAAACPDNTRNPLTSGSIVQSGGSFTKGQGTVLVINGSGGQGLYTINTGSSQNGYFEAWAGSNLNSSLLPFVQSWGLAVFDVSETSLQERYVPASGTFTDSFTISSGPLPTPTQGPSPTPTKTPTPTLTNTPTPQPGTATPTPGSGTRLITYTASSADIANPERGFMKQSSIFLDQPLDATKIRTLDATDRLVWIYFRLDNYRPDRGICTYDPANLTLLDGCKLEENDPTKGLSTLQSAFTTARSKGLKLVIRFIYNIGCQEAGYPDCSTPDFNLMNPDAPIELVRLHINQIMPIVAENADVLATMQAGFVGHWGEWHSSKYLHDIAYRREIIDALLNWLPQDRMVQIRYPRYKEMLYQGPITSAEAFTQASRSRTGHHNDCFLCDSSDGGTYVSSMAQLPRQTSTYCTGQDETSCWQGFLAEESKFTPVGGEASKVNGTRTDCQNATSEFTMFHWSFMNNDFNTSVHDIWKSQGCWETIRQRLGYRLVLTRATMPQSIQAGGSMNLHIELRNDGYAAMYNPRPVIAFLKNLTTNDTYQIPLSTIDPRRWESGQSYSYDIPVSIPSIAVPGSYKLGLWLPDANAQLKNTPAYAVQFANTTSSEGTSTWEDTTGMNILTSNIQVTNQSLPGDTDGNGVVDSVDLSKLVVNFGRINANLNQGNFNGDGSVNILDLSILLSNFGLIQ